MENKKILSVKNLNKSFGEFKAVNNINLQVNQGDIYGFLGPNGAGKSTTLRMILGLIKPDSGEILINGKRTPYADTDDYGRMILCSDPSGKVT